MPQIKIHNAIELEALVQKVGFLVFFGCSIPHFFIGPHDQPKVVLRLGKLPTRKVCLDAHYAVTDDVLGVEVTRGTYDRSPEEFQKRIIHHLGYLCPRVLDGELEKLNQ